jgi:NitT/TauT family transport system substrate-binding protein
VFINGNKVKMLNRVNDKISTIVVFSIVISLLSSSSVVLINAQMINKIPPIKIGMTVWVPNFLAFIAQEKGFFKKNNVDVNLTLIQDYNNAINTYSNGEVDGIFTVYSDAIIQHSAGVNTKVVYNVDSSFKADAIVGKGNSLLDIKGKNISVDGINSFSHLFVLKSLEKVGLNEGDLEFVNIPVQNVSTALQKGDIFAGHTYEPFVSDAEKKGFKILSTGADVPGIITNVLAFHSDIVQQRPQDIQNIIKSMIEAKADYDKNKEQDVSIMASKSGLSKDQIIEGINNVKLLDLNYNIQNSMNRTSTNTTSLYVSGNYFAKFYSERGVISEYPNMDDLVDPQFVNALNK